MPKAVKKKMPQKPVKKKVQEESPEVYADEEQGILPKETLDVRKTKMKAGEEDEDIYTDDGAEALEEDDEIEPWEEGFMEGASGTGQLGKDALTGKPLMDVEDVVEMEIAGKKYRFSSRANALKFKEKIAKEKKQGKK